jgi:hypothetical protein
MFRKVTKYEHGTAPGRGKVQTSGVGRTQGTNIYEEYLRVHNHLYLYKTAQQVSGKIGRLEVTGTAGRGRLHDNTWATRGAHGQTTSQGCDGMLDDGHPHGSHDVSLDRQQTKGQIEDNDDIGLRGYVGPLLIKRRAPLATAKTERAGHVPRSE